jgi:hypothetical protein
MEKEMTNNELIEILKLGLSEDELEKLSTVGNARLLHYCFDPSPRRFSPI